MEIKHLYNFTAVFEDGTVIKQDRNDPNGDRSLTQENGSRFTDVQNKEKESKLVSFVVHDDTNSWGVDLRDGHFEINGRPFFQHRPDLEPYKDFRVIFYRTNRAEISPVTREILATDTKFYGLGWQVTYKNENVKRQIIF